MLFVLVQNVFFWGGVNNVKMTSSVVHDSMSKNVLETLIGEFKFKVNLLVPVLMKNTVEYSITY